MDSDLLTIVFALLGLNFLYYAYAAGRELRKLRRAYEEERMYCQHAEERSDILASDLDNLSAKYERILDCYSFHVRSSLANNFWIVEQNLKTKED